MKNSKIFFLNTSIILFSIILSLSFVELFFRLYLFGIEGNPFKIQNWAIKGVWDVERSPVELSYKYGWIPKVGSFNKNTPPHTITIDNNSFRNNHPLELIDSSRKTILFSGDSFTFGDGVNDYSTFPSFFQSITKDKVLNGGVPAYGIDQMYLRSLDIIQDYKISDLFFCFIPDDINRCNNSTFHKVQKPYFNFEGDSTRLIPINPENFSNSITFNLSLFHKIGGYSLVIDKLMGSFFPEFWSYSVQISKKKEHGKGNEVSVQLINLLKKECDKRNINFFVVPLAHQRYAIDHIDNLQFVLNNLDKGINIVNVFKKLEKIRLENPELFSSYFLKKNYHFSKLGNEFVANYIYSEILNFPFNK